MIIHHDPRDGVALAAFKSEWWPASRRNSGRLQIGTPGRLRRNTHDGRRGVFPQHELARLPPATDDAPDAPVLLDRPAAHRLNGLDDEVVRSQTSTDPGLQLRCMVLIKHKRKLARERRLAKSSARRRFAPHGPSGPSLCCYASIQAKPVAPHNAGLASYAVFVSVNVTHQRRQRLP